MIPFFLEFNQNLFAAHSARAFTPGERPTAALPSCKPAQLDQLASQHSLLSLQMRQGDGHSRERGEDQGEAAAPGPGLVGGVGHEAPGDDDQGGLGDRRGALQQRYREMDLDY